MRLRKLITTAAVLALVFITLAMTRGDITAAPTFTGDAPADFIGADVIMLNDREFPDVGLPRGYYSDTVISGFDIRAVYLEYDPATDVMYVGIDCFVICGDADGDGDPDAAGPVLGESTSNGGLGGTDAPRFGDGESFGLLFDTNNDYDVLAQTGGFEVVIGVSEDVDTDGIAAYTFEGEIGEQLIGDTWVTALPNTITLFAAPSADMPDLEFTIADFSTLPGLPTQAEGLPPFQVHAAMGSSVDDGIGEDYAPDQTNPIVITPSPTPTSTFVPTVPSTPTSTFVPTEPPTPTPTSTLVPTVPPPTPTTPPPTEVPPTGADLGARMAMADVTYQFDVERQAAMRGISQGDFALDIPTINLKTKVLERGWSTIHLLDGTEMVAWDEVSYAPGWHKNSAMPGESGNIVMSGHNNVAGSVFRDLWKLEAGEEVHLSFNRVRYTYVVESVSVDKEQYATEAQRNANAAHLQQTDDNRLTLITCWPWYGNSHRVFVVAKLKSMRPEGAYVQ